MTITDDLQNYLKTGEEKYYRNVERAIKSATTSQEAFRNHGAVLNITRSKIFPVASAAGTGGLCGGGAGLLATLCGSSPYGFFATTIGSAAAGAVMNIIVDQKARTAAFDCIALKKLRHMAREKLLSFVHADDTRLERVDNNLRQRHH